MKLRGGRGFKRCQCDQRNGQPEYHFKPTVGNTLDLRRGYEVDYQCKRRLIQCRNTQNTDAAHFYQAGNLSRCSREDPIVRPPQQGLVIGDEPGAAVDQAQGKIRLPGA